MRATAAPLGICTVLVVFVVAHRLHSWVNVLVVSLLLEACVGSSGTMKASPEGGSFLDRSSSGPLDPVSDARGIFSNRDLALPPGRPPRTVAIAYNIFGSLLDNPDQQHKNELLMPVLGFC